jgi:hypothetical protein
MDLLCNIHIFHFNCFFQFSHTTLRWLFLKIISFISVICSIHSLHLIGVIF